jgi:hypothetical protein
MENREPDQYPDNREASTPPQLQLTNPEETTPGTPLAAAPVRIPPVWERRSIQGYIWGIAACLIALYILNNILENYVMPFDPNSSKDYPGFILYIINSLAAIKVSFLTKDFISCLWAVNTTITIAILGLFSLLLYRPRWYHHLVHAFIGLVTILPLLVIYEKFPLFFSTGSMTENARIALFVLMAIFGVAFLSEFIKFVILRLRRDFS